MEFFLFSLVIGQSMPKMHNKATSIDMINDWSMPSWRQIDNETIFHLVFEFELNHLTIDLKIFENISECQRLKNAANES